MRAVLIVPGDVMLIPTRQDQENSTILHLLATLPSPLTPTTSKKPGDLQRAAVRMSILYWEACKQRLGSLSPPGTDPPPPSQSPSL